MALLVEHKEAIVEKAGTSGFDKQNVEPPVTDNVNVNVNLG